MAWRDQFWGWTLALAVLALASGCESNRYNVSRIVNEPAPVPDAVRNEFGVVGALPSNYEPRFYFRSPLNKAEAAEKLSVDSFGAMEKATRFHWSSDARAVPAELAMEVTRIFYSAILSGTVGTLGGIISGVSETKLKEAEAAIRQALRDDPLEKGVISNIYHFAGNKQCETLAAIPQDLSAKLSRERDRKPDFSSLTNAGIDSVLLIRFYNQHFGVPEGINPPVTYVASADVKIVRARDGELLHAGYLEYHSRHHTFTAWGANGAKFFRGETRRAQRIFADVIFDQLLAIPR